RLLDGPGFEQGRAQAAGITEPGTSRYLTSAETIGGAAVDGPKCWGVELTMNSGGTAAPCFGGADGLLVEPDRPQGGVEVESYFHDYKAFGPVKMASRIVARAAGQEQILTIESVDYDAVDPAALRLPAEVQALITN